MSSGEPQSAGLLDTSVVIVLEQLSPAQLPGRLLISTLTLAELAVGPLVATTEEERAVRTARLRQVEADLDTVPFDDQAARAFGVVAASMGRRGRKPTARSLDAAIAATALANGLALYTANPDDVLGIDGLDVVTVPPVDRSS
ncbi:MAG: type II toxin-antitoxin system VapC family toxin [Iamia sp.]